MVLKNAVMSQQEWDQCLVVILRKRPAAASAAAKPRKTQKKPWSPTVPVSFCQSAWRFDLVCTRGCLGRAWHGCRSYQELEKDASIQKTSVPFTVEPTPTLTLAPDLPPLEPPGVRSCSLLGTAVPTAVLATVDITNTGPSIIVGDVNTSEDTAPTGFADSEQQVLGTIVSPGTFHTADAAALAARADAQVAYSALHSVACTAPPFSPLHDDLAGSTLVPGVYCFDSTAQIGAGGTLILDARGLADAVFVFKVGSALTTFAESRIAVINDPTGSVAKGCNVFWVVGSSATLGTNTSEPTRLSFIGTVLAIGSATAGTGANIAGRLLAGLGSGGGSVTLDTNIVVPPGCDCVVAP